MGSNARARSLRLRTRLRWRGSADYWERRYASGGTSGEGSYGQKARHKADIVNRMVRDHNVRTVIELGCGDGNQLKYADYPEYLGLDVSGTAIASCVNEFRADTSKSFLCSSSDLFADHRPWLRADASLSMEVIFHLVEDEVFEDYMRRLFAMAEHQVIICSSNRDDLPRGPHERHRRFTPWVEANISGWRLAETVEPSHGLVSGFFRYEAVDH